MSSTPVLPLVSDLGFYEMRFEAVGGLGANLAGQLLAESLVLRQGFNGAHFSSYGSEKKGSPVKSFLRICPPGMEVRSSSPVERPHLLAVFHQCLLRVPGTTAGLDPRGVLIVNSADSVSNVKARTGATCATLGVVDALAIAVAESSRINTVMLGAIARAAGFIDPAAVKESITHSFRSRYPNLVQSNIRAFERGYAEVALEELGGGGPEGAAREKEAAAAGPAIGYANAPIGGVIVNPGNTAHKDLSASRQGMFPLYHRDRCIDCGLCTMTCPDYVFVWGRAVDKNGRTVQVLRGPNYQYCKGCLKCVDICPVDALTDECERPEFNYTADVQLWGPPDALVTMSRDNEPAKWEPGEGKYWYRVG